MKDLLNRVRIEASNVLNSVATVRTGIVDSYDPDTFTCVVQYEPERSESVENSLSQSLPIAALAIGNGFGILAAPNIGDRVAVGFVGGSNDVGFVCGAIFNNDAHVPPPAAAGEYCLIHQSGSFVKLMSTGDLLLNGQTTITMTSATVNITTTANVNVNAPTGVINFDAPQANFTGNVSIDGDLDANNGSVVMTGGTFTTSGDITSQQDIHADGAVSAGSIDLGTHIHSGVTTGGSNTGAPV